MSFMVENKLLFDWIYTLIALVGIIFIIFCLEQIYKKAHIPAYITRKMLHLVIGLLVCLSVPIIYTPIPIVVIASIFIIVNWFAVKRQKLKSVHINASSYGTVYYPLAAIILVLFLWQDDKPAFVLAILIMSLADTLAGIIGDRYARKYFVPAGEKKSVIGSTGMFLTTFIILTAGFIYFYCFTLEDSLIFALIISIPVTVTETLSSKGSDNLFVPVVAALCIYIVHGNTEESLKYQLIYGEILSIIICYLSFYFKFLNISGMLIVFLLGTIIFGLGALAFAVPILTFYIFSSLLSKMGKKRKKLIILFLLLKEYISHQI